MLGDARGIVHRLRAPHHESRVVVSPLIELGRTEQERRDNRSRAVECADALEVQHAVADHFRPDTQVAPTSHVRERRVGKRANTHLQRTAVSRETRDVLTNPERHVVGLAFNRARQRRLDLYSEVDHVKVQLAVATGIGHLGVHLGNDEPPAPTDLFYGGRHDVHLDPQ